MVEFLQSYGLIGLFLGSFLAATVIPFSSEILLTGVLLAGINPYEAFVVATAGNWLGGAYLLLCGAFGKVGDNREVVQSKGGDLTKAEEQNREVSESCRSYYVVSHNWRCACNCPGVLPG